MNYKKNICHFCAVLLFAIFICGCTPKEVTCPFTEITWEHTLDDILTLEGDPIETYPSTYYGTTYSFSKNYRGMEGTIKYMFDDKEQLVSMAWLYIPDSSDELDEVYEELVAEVTDTYGDSGFSSAQTTARGEVWYQKEGNILVAVMSTGVNDAVQYQFFHPDVSSEKPNS